MAAWTCCRVAAVSCLVLCVSLLLPRTLLPRAGGRQEPGAAPPEGKRPLLAAAPPLSAPRPGTARCRWGEPGAGGLRGLREGPGLRRPVWKPSVVPLGACVPPAHPLATCAVPEDPFVVTAVTCFLLFK